MNHVVIGVLSGFATFAAFLALRAYVFPSANPTSLTPLSNPDAQQVATWGVTAMQHGYFQRVLCAVDQFLNVLTGGNLDETMSARSARYWRTQQGAWVVWRKFGEFMCWWLDIIQSLHDIKAEAGDLARAEAIVNLERSALGLPPVNLTS